MPFGPGGLVVTWVVPVPEQAEVSWVNNGIFEAVNRVAGPEIPRDFPAKYRKNLQRVQVFNSSMFWDTEALTAWEKRHGIDEMEEEPLSIFDDYLKGGNVLLGALVRHPAVAKSGFFVSCSVVLQRAIVVFANGREDLYLKSYFHSSRDESNFVNFVPAGGFRISFKSDKIWFPLELTRVIQEPYSYVVLDVLTEKPLDLGQLPKSFQAAGTGGAGMAKSLTLGRASYSTTRIVARLSGKEKSPDLNLRPE
jgi:hypothetical protein